MDPSVDEIVDWITGHATGITDFSIVDLNKSHNNLALDGPYAWELCAEVFGPDVLGLPYLGVLGLGDMFVFRAGRTGEYGYHLLVPMDEKNAWIEKLLTTGIAFEMARADASIRAQCVLENFFFDINTEGQYNLTPLELQLQWRLSSQKTVYPGAEAIRTLRQSGWTRRLTCFTTPDLVNLTAEITCDGEIVGHVLAIGYSPARGDYVGKALLRQPYWHAGLDAFQVDGCPLKTISAPAINNLSLKVSFLPSQFSHARGGPDLMRWESSTVLVTGASRGLGRDHRQSLCCRGCFRRNRLPPFRPTGRTNSL